MNLRPPGLKKRFNFFALGKTGLTLIVFLLIDIYWIFTTRDYVEASKLEPYTHHIMASMARAQSQLTAARNHYFEFYLSKDSLARDSAAEHIANFERLLNNVRRMASDSEQIRRLQNITVLLNDSLKKASLPDGYQPDQLNGNQLHIVIPELRYLKMLDDSIVAFHSREKEILQSRLEIFTRTFHRAMAVSILVLLTNLFLIFFFAWQVRRKILERQNANEELARRQESYKTILGNIPLSVALSNIHTGEIIYINQTFQQHFEVTANDEAEEVFQKLRIGFTTPKRAKEKTKSAEYCWKMANGEHHIYLYEANVVQIHDEELILHALLDITARKNYEKELKKSQHKLQETLDAKDRFFSILSHDIRSPLSTVIGFSDLLVEETDHPYAKTICETSENLLTLLNNVLQWSRAQSGTMRFQPAMVNLHQIVEQVYSIHRSTAGENGIRLSNEVTPDEEWTADPYMLETILRNLVSNSLKFTSNGDSITVSARKKQNNLLIEVIDTGSGIAPEKLPTLFSLRKYNGTPQKSGNNSGLGLLLCKELVKRHQGTISAESIPGKVTIFKIRLPEISKISPAIH
ncbi:sensor histidine kinase [Prolixibacter denitrificans]|uniref:histidine kinase n=1 Tax=Prolixibacter denitrificans TaxID=1541063 RepID=A0A2P8CAP7_9BACT|nr:HAMP domain-containing sensor histidine kinase [Prolixibacter denitrificans]PSK82036.1 phospho-acceptor domain-containing protein [Prolixibacter denitrificans]GET22629.1 hypothetical protein JCM18694_28750 [Prolixibacter denitrificans]